MYKLITIATNNKLQRLKLLYHFLLFKRAIDSAVNFRSIIADDGIEFDLFLNAQIITQQITKSIITLFKNGIVGIIWYDSATVIIIAQAGPPAKAQSAPFAVALL